MREYKKMIKWLDKSYIRAKPRHVPTIDALRELVEAAMLGEPKPPAPSATAVSEPRYSPSHLPEALPPASALGGEVAYIEFSDMEVSERARHIYFARHPDAVRIAPHHEADVMHEAREQLRVEHRARDRYEDTKEFNDPSWTGLSEGDRQQWIVNERNAIR